MIMTCGAYSMSLQRRCKCSTEWKHVEACVWQMRVAPRGLSRGKLRAGTSSIQLALSK
jgi:hypothetical protein